MVLRAALTALIAAFAVAGPGAAGSSGGPQQRDGVPRAPRPPGFMVGQLPWRSWTLLNTNGSWADSKFTPDWNATVSYVTGPVLQAAQSHGINHLQLSQQLVWNAEDALNDVTRRGALESIAVAAAGKGINTTIWVHEFSECPPGHLHAGKCVLDDAVWPWVTEKYRKLWVALPSVSGVVLTISETAFDVTCEEGCKVASNDTVPVRLNKLIQAVVAGSPGRTVIMRAFVHTPTNLRQMTEALAELDTAPAAASGGRLIVMAKAPPCDWNPYFPFNPLWSLAAANITTRFDLIMELDLGLEMLGQNAFAAPSVEHTLAQVNRAREMSAIGVSARIERGCLPAEVGGSCRPGQPNAYTLNSDRFNDVSLTALSVGLRGVSNISTTEAQMATVWGTWSDHRFSRHDAVPFVRRALEPLFEVVARAYFPLGQFVMQHSNIPLFKYIVACLDPHGYVATYLWTPSPSLQTASRRLLAPQVADLAALRAEQQAGMATVGRSRQAVALGVAAGSLTAGEAAQLTHAVNTSALCVRAFGAVLNAAIGATVVGAGGNNALPGEIAALRTTIVSELAALEGMVGAWPLEAQSVQSFVADTNKRLNEAL